MEKNYYWSLATKIPSTDYVQRWGATQKMQLRVTKLSLPVKLYRKCVCGNNESSPQNTAQKQWIWRHSFDKETVPLSSGLFERKAGLSAATSNATDALFNRAKKQFVTTSCVTM